MIKGIVIPALHADQIRLVDLPDDTNGRLSEMQRIVGGYIQLVPLGIQMFTMYCNEEGKLRGLPTNSRATLLVAPLRSWYDPLAGDVLIVGLPTRGGDDTSVSEDAVQHVESTLGPLAVR